MVLATPEIDTRASHVRIEKTATKPHLGERTVLAPVAHLVVLATPEIDTRASHVRIEKTATKPHLVERTVLDRPRALIGPHATARRHLFPLTN